MHCSIRVVQADAARCPATYAFEEDIRAGRLDCLFGRCSDVHGKPVASLVFKRTSAAKVAKPGRSNEAVGTAAFGPARNPSKPVSSND
jgi:hypothetical protein